MSAVILFNEYTDFIYIYNVKRLLFLLFLFPLSCFADNTAFVQNIINTSGTLPAASYVCTNLTITHSFNMHGSTINLTGSGVCMNMNTTSVTLSNGTIVGNSDNTTSNQAAIGMNAANTTVSAVVISRFGQYAVTGGLYSNEVITGCAISDIGFLGISMISNSGTVTGIQITNNVVDRSMQPTSVPQPAIILRCFAPGTNSGGIISGNTIKMPVNPVPNAAEICEVSGCIKVSAHNNVVSGGTIGFSIVGASNGTQLYSNTYSHQRDYSIECGGSINCLFHNETISSGRIGAIFDGGYLTTADTLSNSTISGLTSFPIQLITSLTSGIVLNNLTVNTTTNAILVQNGAAGLTINGGTYVGNSTTYAIFSSNSPGQIYLNSVIFTGFTPKLIIAGSTSPGLIYNNVVGNLVVLTPGTLGVTAGSNTVLGANIVFTNNTAPTITYPSSTYTFTQYVAISTLTPTVTGSPTSFSISPTIPAGLSFSSSTGIIQGTAIVPQSATGYVVSAHNATGIGNFNLSLTVLSNSGGGGVIRQPGLTIILK